MSIRAILVGATGLIGGELLSLLCKDPEIAAIHAAGRRRVALEHPKLTQQIIDFNSFAQNGAQNLFPPADVLFSCLGTTIKNAGSQEAFRKVDLDAVVETARQARAADIPCLVVVSAMGADPASGVFYNRTKGEMERAVRALGFESVGIVRPSLLAGQRSEFRVGERVALLAMHLARPLIPAKYRAVSAAAVAAAMLDRAKHPQQGVHILESDQIQRFA